MLKMLASHKFSHRFYCQMLTQVTLFICGGYPSAFKHTRALQCGPCMASIELAQQEAIGLLKLSIRHLYNNVTGSGLEVD